MHGHHDPNRSLEPTMGLISGTAMVCGLMIGSGIFSTPGAIWELVGSPGAAMILWIVGGIITYCGTFCYIELGTMIPLSGGEQVYLERAFRKPRALFAYLFCISMIFCIRPGSAAADSTVFGKYLVYATIGPQDQLPPDSPLLAVDNGYDWVLRGLGIVCITTITLLNIFSVKWSIRVHDLLTGIKVLILALISVTGIVVLCGGAPTQVPDPMQNWRGLFDGTKTDPNGYASAMFKIFWAYDGWSNLNLSVAELKNPRRNLPIAAGLGVTIVTILYLLANMAYLTVVPQDQAFASQEILAGTFFEIMFGTVAGRNVLPVFIALSAYGAVSAMVFSGSRVIYVAAKEKYLPFGETLGAINERFGTPVNALIFNWVWTMALMLAPPPGEAFSFLVDLVGYPSWIFYGISVCGLLYMRRTHPTKLRPFKVFPPAAVLFIVVAVFLVVFPFVPPTVPDSTSTIPYFLSAALGLVVCVLPVILWWIQVANGGDLGRAFRRLVRRETIADEAERKRDYREWNRKLDAEEEEAMLKAAGIVKSAWEPQVPEWRDQEVHVAV